MRIDIHIHHHFDLGDLGHLVQVFTKEVRKVSEQSDRIIAKVEAQTTVLAGMEVTIDELNGQSVDIKSEIERLRGLIENPETLDALEAKVDAQGEVLNRAKVAIQANVEPQPEPQPE